jgi:cysteine desulfuration protein SufE
MSTHAAPLIPLSEISETFTLLEDWEDRYRYIIELGQKLPPLPETDKTGTNQVSGCASQVWIVTHFDQGQSVDQSPPRLQFSGESDAHIVRGLVAIILSIYTNKTPQDILSIDALDIFKQLGLSDHLSTQRANGVRAVMGRILSDAKRAADTPT